MASIAATCNGGSGGRARRWPASPLRATWDQASWLAPERWWNQIMFRPTSRGWPLSPLWVKRRYWPSPLYPTQDQASHFAPDGWRNQGVVTLGARKAASSLTSSHFP